MKRFIEGENRAQRILLPDCLDDYVGEENPVRVVDAFVDHLDLGTIGFEGIVPAATGRPSYHPAVLLKLCIYGYLNRIQSSRRLEREAQRNVELMWLVERLTPDFKTIADFRRDNGKAIRAVCRQFIVLCRKLDLFAESIIAIDGSKFKAVNNRDRNFTPAKLKAHMAQIEESIDRYMEAMNTADRTRAETAAPQAARLNDKITKLKQQMQELQAMEQRLKEEPDGQVSLTDPDTRSMATSGRGTGMVGYNVQTAVDSKHHLIVAHEVTDIGHDRGALHKMAEQAQQATGIDAPSVVADRGYFRGEQTKACEDAGITAYLPKPLTSNAKAKGRFGKQDFVYQPGDDEYLCPAGQRAIYRFGREEAGLNIRVYWSSDCPRCAIRSQCITATGDYRRIRRWEHEAVLEVVQRRLNHHPEMVAVRRQTVEHPFGTIKHWMGATHFLPKTLKRVGTEMSLHVLAYNLKRLMKILGPVETIISIKV